MDGPKVVPELHSTENAKPPATISDTQQPPSAAAKPPAPVVVPPVVVVPLPPKVTIPVPQQPPAVVVAAVAGALPQQQQPAAMASGAAFLPMISSSSSSKHIKAQIYVDNLPSSMTEVQFRTLFEPFGKLASCKFLKHRSGGETGYGFVAFADPMTAGIAINKLNTRLIDGHNIRVTDAKPESQLLSQTNLYVCGLPVTFSSEQLKRLFSAFGTIAEARVLHTAPNTTEAKGVGFVHFQRPDQAKAACVAMNDNVPPGFPPDCPLVVKFAREVKRGVRAMRGRGGFGGAMGRGGPMGMMNGGGRRGGFMNGFGNPRARVEGTNICRYFQSGRCNRGNDCNFSHQPLPQMNGVPWPGHPQQQHPMPPWNGHMPVGPAGPWPPPGVGNALRVPGKPAAGGPGSTSGDPASDRPGNNAPSVSSKDAGAGGQPVKGPGWRDPWTNSSVSNADPWAALPAESNAWNGLRPALNGDKPSGPGGDDKARPPGHGDWIPKGRAGRPSDASSTGAGSYTTASRLNGAPNANGHHSRQPSSALPASNPHLSSEMSAHDSRGAHPPTSRTNLYVSQFPTHWGVTDLEKLFSKFGAIDKTRILTDPNAEENRGVGFVHFKEAVSASAALEALNDSTPDGCEQFITVKFANQGTKNSKFPGSAAGICRFWVKGECTRGNACAYKHEGPGSLHPDTLHGTAAGPAGRRIQPNAGGGLGPGDMPRVQPNAPRWNTGPNPALSPPAPGGHLFPAGNRNPRNGHMHMGMERDAVAMTPGPENGLPPLGAMGIPMMRPLMSQASYQSEFDLSLSLPGGADFMTPRFTLPHDPSTQYYHLPPMTPAGVLPPPPLTDYGRTAYSAHPYDLSVMTPSADPLLSGFGGMTLGPDTPGHISLPSMHASAAAYAAASPGAYAFAPFTPPVDAKLPPPSFYAQHAAFTPQTPTPGPTPLPGMYGGHLPLYAPPSRGAPTAMNNGGAAALFAAAAGTAAAARTMVAADPSAPLSAYSASGVLSPPASNNPGVPYGLALTTGSLQHIKKGASTNPEADVNGTAAAPSTDTKNTTAGTTAAADAAKATDGGS